MFIGGTKEGELQRSADLYLEIANDPERGPFFALYFIYDSQHDRQDVKRILDNVQERGLHKQREPKV